MLEHELELNITQELIDAAEADYNDTHKNWHSWSNSCPIAKAIEQQYTGYFDTVSVTPYGWISAYSGNEYFRFDLGAEATAFVATVDTILQARRYNPNFAEAKTSLPAPFSFSAKLVERN